MKYRYSSSGNERKRKIVQFDESVRSEDFVDLLEDCDGHIVKAEPHKRGRDLGGR